MFVMILFSILTQLNAKILRVCRRAGFIHTACSCSLQYGHACRGSKTEIEKRDYYFYMNVVKSVFFFCLCFIGNIYVQKLYYLPVFRG